MSKAYKGYELIKEIAEGNIKDNTKIIPHYPNNNCTVDYFIYRYGFIHAFTNGIEKEDVNVCIFLDDVRTFVIEEEPEIDIQEIEKIRDYRTSEDDLYNDNFEDFRGVINDLVDAVKQLDCQINGNKQSIKRR